MERESRITRLSRHLCDLRDIFAAGRRSEMFELLVVDAIIECNDVLGDDSRGTHKRRKAIATRSSQKKRQKEAFKLIMR